MTGDGNDVDGGTEIKGIDDKKDEVVKELI